MAQEKIEEAIEQEIMRRIVRERLRIWQELFQASSVQVIPDGRKESVIISIGEPKLKSIILPELPDWFVPEEIDPNLPEVLPAPHPSFQQPPFEKRIAANIPAAQRPSIEKQSFEAGILDGAVACVQEQEWWEEEEDESEDSNKTV